MNCPICGKENPDDALECRFCKATMTNPWDSSNPVNVRVSRLAIKAIIFAFCGVILYLIPFLITFSSRRLSESGGEWISTAFSIAFLLGLVSLVISFFFGIISIIRIETSGGLITGRSFAIGAVLIPIFCVCLSFWLIASPRTRGTAYRMVCGINLSQIGMAMMLYANDNDNQFPHAGGKNSVWANKIPDWKAQNRFAAYGLATDGSGGDATISSSLYLLVKYTEIKPKTFICKNDSKTEEFDPAKYRIRDLDISRLWDFGPEPWKHYSYSYHMPYGDYALTTSSNPEMAVAADRNPWIVSPAGVVKDFKLFNPDGDRNDIMAGNSPTHRNETQNVLFVDIHVSQEKTSACGLNDDNIYTSWDGEDIRRGTPPKPGSQPANKLDSLLINDPPIKKP